MSKRRSEEARRSQKRENLLTLKKVSKSHRESAAWEEEATRKFDRWFFSLPKEQQETMRRQGVKPYREQGDPRRGLAPLFEKSNYFGYTEGDGRHVEQESFISRDKVKESISRILATLSFSSSPEVRLHMELVKIALKTDDALNGEELGAIHGISRAGINWRVQRMRDILAGRPMTPAKESPNGGGASRVALHRVKKIRTPPKK